MRGNNVGEDLKAMAQEVVDLGAGYMRMGRRWLEIQRDQVAEAYETGPHREDPSKPGEGRRRNEGRGPGRRPNTGSGGWRGGVGASAGPDSYLDDRPSPRYASPGGTESPFASSHDGPQSDYLPPDSTTFGRTSYRGVGPKNYTRSDQRITEDLCEGLTHDREVDPSDISVNVSGGVVTLGGTVRERWMKHRVEDMAAACYGVRRVENNIQIPVSTPPSESTGPDVAPNAGVDG